MPSVSLGHAWMFGFEMGWKRWEDFLFDYGDGRTKQEGEGGLYIGVLGR